MSPSQIDNIFTYHVPNQSQIEKYTKLREKGKELAYLINTLAPESREKSLALTDLQRCIQMANAAIAINEKPAQTDMIQQLFPAVLDSRVQMSPIMADCPCAYCSNTI